MDGLTSPRFCPRGSMRRRSDKFPSCFFLLFLLLVVLAGCGGGGSSSPSTPSSTSTPAPSSSSSSTITCKPVAVSVSGQVQNPVSLLHTDNNGVLVELPGVSSSGASSVSGSLLLGIGTKSNNTPSAVTAFPLDDDGDFTTIYNGASYGDSFIDTGSNGLFFPSQNNKALPLCPDGQWYCPQATFSNSATQVGFGGSPQVKVPFTIGNFETLTSADNGANRVFPDIGGPGSTFDWGLPFYFGQNIFIGIKGTSSKTLGQGPYFASGFFNGSQATGANVIPITVNGSLCLNNAYNNEPCVSIQVCTPGTNTCQTINGILLDTGSYGLRIFKSVLNGLSLGPVSTSSGGQLAECLQYADGTADWGPVETADVVLGGEPAVTVPVQVIDSTFPGSSNCSGTLDTGPSIDGYNGILGVGPLQQDCGQVCADLKNLTSFAQWPYWSCGN